MRAARSNTLTTPRGPAVGQVRTSVVGLLREAARLDRTQSDPVVATRNAIGVVAPLAVGVLAGDAALGLAAAIGALQTAFADRPGPYRLRMLRLLGTAFAAALTAGLAIAASRSDVASVGLLLVFAFIAGLLLVGGPSATQVGVAAMATALILGHTPLPPSVAVHVGLLVLAGGAVQAVLAIAAWPLRRHRPERLALAGLYAELAHAARLPQGSSVGPPAGDTLTAVRQTLYGLGHDHGPSVEAYRVLLDEAERVRREIVVLVGIAERLEDEAGPECAGLVRAALAAAGTVLDDVADGLRQARPVRAEVLEAARGTVRNAITRLGGDATEPARLSRQAAAGRLRALSGQLRAIVESTETGASEGRRPEPPPGPGVRLREPLAIVRANLNPGSAVFRHAVRLSLLVAGSDLAVRLADVARGYWVPLTVVVVLRPDFATTFQRSVMRVLGTIVGLLLATGLVHWLPAGDWWSVALIAVLAFGMRLAGPGNLALTAMCLSALVVVLLEISGVPARSTVEDRALATLAGGVLAVVAALAMPAWERRFVRIRLAELLGAYRRYVSVVADLDADRGSLQRARSACRLARSNAQASVDRARSEPVRGHAEVELGRAVLAHTHRFIHAMLGVEALRMPLREAGGVAELGAFLDSVGAVLAAARAAVSSGLRPGPERALRALQEQLAAAVLARPERAGGMETATALVEATDRVTNSLDTLMEELHRQLPAASQG